MNQYTVLINCIVKVLSFTVLAKSEHQARQEGKNIIGSHSRLGLFPPNSRVQEVLLKVREY
jgi:hypothetical protein